MQLDLCGDGQHGLLFVWRGSFATKDYPKQAGFHWHAPKKNQEICPPNCYACQRGIPNRCWWTEDLICAQVLAEFSSSAARQALNAPSIDQLMVQLREARARIAELEPLREQVRRLETQLRAVNERPITQEPIQRPDASRWSFLEVDDPPEDESK